MMEVAHHTGGFRTAYKAAPPSHNCTDSGFVNMKNGGAVGSKVGDENPCACGAARPCKFIASFLVLVNPIRFAVAFQWMGHICRKNNP